MSNVRSANKLLKIFWAINKQKAVTIQIGFPNTTLLKVKSRAILSHRFTLKFRSFRSFASQKSKPTQISSEQWCQRNKQRWRSCIQWKWRLDLSAHIDVCVSRLCDRERKEKGNKQFFFVFVLFRLVRFVFLFISEMHNRRTTPEMNKMWWSALDRYCSDFSEQ